MKSAAKLFSLHTDEPKYTHCEPPAWKVRVCIGLVLLAPVMVPRSYPQQPTAQAPSLKPILSNPTMHRPPLSHLYTHFLLHQNHLDKLAAERDAQGKNGSVWRNYFQEKLGFTDTEMTVVRATGLRLESELKEIGKQAVDIAKANRAARAQNSSNAPPVPDPRLRDLTGEREDIIDREMNTLNQELGPDSAAKLSDFIQHHYLESSKFRAMLQPHHPPSSPGHLQPSTGKQVQQRPVKP